MLTLANLVLGQDAFSVSANWSVSTGTTTAVIGPSGGGKSTLLNGIAGFVEPARGQIRWNDQDLTSLTPAKRPVSILFQDNNLFPHLSIFENTMLGLSARRTGTPEQRAIVSGALASVGLETYQDRKPAQLSGGQQSRAGLARVMVAQRPVVLLDEPFAALGPALKAEMLDLTAQLTSAVGKTVLMVTHDPADARRIADHVVLVTEGVAQVPVPTDAAFSNPSMAMQDYLGSGTAT